MASEKVPYTHTATSPLSLPQHLLQTPEQVLTRGAHLITPLPKDNGSCVSAKRYLQSDISLPLHLTYVGHF